MWDQGEDEVGQLLHHRQGIVGGEGGDHHSGHGQQQTGGQSVHPLGAALNLQLVSGQGILRILHSQGSPSFH